MLEKSIFLLPQPVKSRTMKVVQIAGTTTFTLTLTDVDSSFDRTSVSSIQSSATSVSTSVISIHPHSGSSCSPGSQDTLILSSPEHGAQRSQQWPTEFPVPRFSYSTELVLVTGNETFAKGGTQANFTSALPDILEKLAECIFQYVDVWYRICHIWHMVHHISKT